MAPPPAAPKQQRAARILAVDDNRDALDAVAAMLRILGHVVVLAENGEQALQQAAALRPEVVLLDIGLPGIDGYETARRLRAEPWGRQAYLVAVTGWGQAKDKQRAAEAGFDDHLTKPVGPDQLERMLNERAAG